MDSIQKEQELGRAAVTLLTLAALLTSDLDAQATSKKADQGKVQAKDLVKAKEQVSVVVFRVLGMKKARSGAT